MNLLLRWQNLVFYIPLAVGILLAIGVASGAADEPDAPDDVDGTPLDVGRVPFIVLATMATLLFGGIGVVVMALLSEQHEQTGPMIAALWFASFGSFVLTRSASRLLARVLPSSETYRVERRDLVGRTGTLVLSTNEASGLAQVRDQEGNVHQVRCLTSGGALPRGTEIVVVDHQEKQNVYVVTPFSQ